MSVTHIVCAVCDQPIYITDYATAYCWTDPHSVTVAAHGACLIRLGERDLGLKDTR